MTAETSMVERVERLRGLLARATSGEWEWWNGCSWWRLGVANSRHQHMVLCPTTDRDGHPNLLVSAEDREFIVAAHNDMPALLDTLTAQQAEIERMRADLAVLGKDMAEYARQAGEAQGRLEMSEAAGVVEMWREECERLRGRVERLEDLALALADGDPDLDGLTNDQALALVAIRGRRNVRAALQPKEGR